MPIVQWKDSFSVKNTAIDKQHQKLLKIINNLYDDFMDGVNDSAYEAAIEKLLAYTEYHFQTEELLMDKARHSNTYNHIMLHRFFTEKIHQLKTTIGHNDRESTKELIEFLVNWILQHIVIEDSKFTQG